MRWAHLLGLLALGCAADVGDAPACELLCPYRSIDGGEAYAEIGFRFGAPRDVDGDGWLDVAIGGRFAQREAAMVGNVRIVSGRDGRELFDWHGQEPGALFGHLVLLTQDLDGDDRAELLVAAPHATAERQRHGELVVRSPASGEVVWQRSGAPGEAFGWHVAFTSDHDGDGVQELLVGAPSGLMGGRVVLLSGADGRELDAYAAPAGNADWGWYVASIEDVDGDSLDDVLVGAPSTEREGASEAGAVALLSSATGRSQWRVAGTLAGEMLGEIVTSVPDRDDDGLDDVAVSATHLRATRGAREGEVRFYSSADGALLESLRGRTRGELYGRFIGRMSDLDGDGEDDVLIGAPWAGERRQGRFELWSGRGHTLLAEEAGEAPNVWLGWHAAAAPDPAPGAQARGVLVSGVYQTTQVGPQAGALQWWLAR